MSDTEHLRRYRIMTDDIPEDVRDELTIPMLMAPDSPRGSLTPDQLKAFAHEPGTVEILLGISKVEETAHQAIELELNANRQLRRLESRQIQNRRKVEEQFQELRRYVDIKVIELNKFLESEADKNKLDWRDILKEWIKRLLIGGAIGGFVYWVKK